MDSRHFMLLLAAGALLVVMSLLFSVVGIRLPFPTYWLEFVGVGIVAFAFGAERRKKFFIIMAFGGVAAVFLDPYLAAFGVNTPATFALSLYLNGLLTIFVLFSYVLGRAMPCKNFK